MLLITKALNPILVGLGLIFCTNSFVFADHLGVPHAKGNAFNPDTSLVGSLLYRNSNRGNNLSDSNPNGFSLDEAELQLAADVDPYLRANTIFSAHRESGKWIFAPEEAYVETLSLALATIKLGKFKSAFGKYNIVHTHALPFIDGQLISKALLGDDGMNGEGLSAAILLPANWYSEVFLQAINANTDPFKSASANATIEVIHLKNLWDLSDELTLEWGLSGADGPNNIIDKHTSFYSSDLTFKWRPVRGGKYSAFVWSSEFVSGNKNINSDGTDNLLGVKTQGGYSFIQWQTSQRWWLQLRTEYVETSDSTANTKSFQRKNSFLLAYLPTEFSGLRLQYDQLVDQGEKSENRLMLQLNFSIGAHPAHSY